MSRFVLLYHDCPPNYPRSSHWDFMLEAGDVLRTWALEQLPSSWCETHRVTKRAYANCPPLADADTVAAEQLADHRRAHLEFEGEVSGNRGRVTRIAAGTYQIEIDSPAHCRVLIDSDQIQGRVDLTRAKANAVAWSVRCESQR